MPADFGLVRVAVEYSAEFCGCGIEMQSVHIVEHVDVVAFEEQHFGFRETAARAALVHVAADGGNRCELLERFENGWVADVAKVQDVFDTGEGGDDFRAQKTMRIADDTNLHRPKLNSSDQRLLVFATSDLMTGLIIWRGRPGACGSSIAMQ